MSRSSPTTLSAASVFLLMLTGCMLPPGWMSDSEMASDDFGSTVSPSDGEVEYSLVYVGSSGRRGALSDLGAITWVTNDTYWAASDSGGIACELTVTADDSSGKILRCDPGRTVTLGGCVDIEGLAYDPLVGLLWASDEVGSAVSGHRMSDGKRMFDLRVPECYSRCRPNLSLESLTIREDGLEMWTCNEGPLEEDGSQSTKDSMSFVRLARFVRKDGGSPWRESGQWAYPVGRMHGGSFRGIQVRGVADMCVLPDGTLLTLEREFSWSILPCFRCRIYQVGFAGSTEVSGRDSLSAADIVPVSRRRLWAGDMMFSNYEGMGLGRRLADGSRLLLLVSDGDGHTRERICSFRLYAKQTGAGH